MTRLLLFPASIAAFERITHTFAFHDPCVVGMWTLRNRVASFLSSNPDASHDDINQTFVQGSGIRSADLKTACVQATWESQQAEFAGLLLVTLVAQYESFVNSLCSELGITDRDVKKQLLYATSSKYGAPYGIRPAIASLTASRSDMLQAAFYPLLMKHKKNSLATLDALMLCYRYFKECRNCYIHNGRYGTKALQRAYSAFQGVADPSLLGVNETPQHFPVSVNEPVQLTLRGVAGFGDVLFRLVATLDAELSKAKAAEMVFVARWQQAVSQHVRQSHKQSTRTTQLRKVMRAMRMPDPNEEVLLESFLVSRGLLAAAPASEGNDSGSSETATPSPHPTPPSGS